MMRWKTLAICMLTLSACNLSDPIDEWQGPGDNNGTANNVTDDAGNNDTGGDGTDGGTPTVTVTNVLVGGAALPATVEVGSTFTVEADVTAQNSPGCPGCAIQVVVGVMGANNSPECLYDGPATAAGAGSADLQAPATPGSGDLVWAALETTDCAAALAAVTAMPPATTSLGGITFEEAGPLEVVFVSPAADEVDVTVTSTIRVAFDAPLDPASVQGRVTLGNSAGAVPATVAVNANEIVITPSDDLDEFQTQYNVRVSAGVTSGPRSLDADFTSRFTTRMFVADRFYAAGNAFHGVGYSLAIDAANQCTIVVTDDTAPNQRFRFVPRDGGWIAYNSAPTAGGRALDAGDGTMPCSMLPLSATPDANQIWKFVANASTAGTFWMQNNRFNETQSLDATNTAPTSGAYPLMQATTDVPRQRWRWRRLP